MTIADILTPRQEVVEGRFQGVLQAHKVGDADERLENDPHRLLSMTYPSNALETAFDHIDNKLRGRDSQGGITLTGPYGAGKSHALLALHHLFKNPALGQEWLDEWEHPLNLPDNAQASILSTSETDADRIWEPVFRDLGREDLLDEIKRYPTTEHIEELVGETPTAIFFDEIETWWESFDDEDDEVLIERNEFFLQHLLEVANDPDEQLFVFVTLLDKSQDLKRILNRTNPYAVDLNDTGDRERIILHRLFATNREELDRQAVRDVVTTYVENYTYPVDIDEPKRYEDRMVETYPFHPEVLNLLNNLYEGGRGRQNVRGAMNVLADTVRRYHDETNLIVTCDIEPAAFRGINQTLFNRYNSDCDEVSEIECGDDLLRTILLYTLDDRSQEASVTECLVGTYKPEKTSVNRLEMSLGKLYGTAHYLDRDSEDGPYYLTEDPKLTALVTREQDRALDNDRDAVLKTLIDVVREDVWNDAVAIHPKDEISDNSSLSVVVSLNYLSNGSLRTELDEFFEGRKYQNAVLFVTPQQDVRDDTDIVKKAGRLYGAENLDGKVDDENGDLRSIIRSERRELRNELQDRYGKLVTWSEQNGDLRLRRKNVTPDVQDVKERASSDKTYIGDAILSEVKGATNGISVEALLNNFKQFRRLPVVVNDETFYQSVRQLHRDEDIVLEGDRAKFYVAQHNEYPAEIEDDLTIHHPSNLDDSVFEPESPETDDEVGTEPGSGQETTTSIGINTGSRTTTTESTRGENRATTSTSPGGYGGDAGQTGEQETEMVEVTLEGNAARVLRSQAQSRVNANTDTITDIELEYDIESLSKDALLEFLDQLPDANQINVELVIERDVDD